MNIGNVGSSLEGSKTALGSAADLSKESAQTLQGAVAELTGIEQTIGELLDRLAGVSTQLTTADNEHQESVGYMNTARHDTAEAAGGPLGEAELAIAIGYITAVSDGSCDRNNRFSEIARRTQEGIERLSEVQRSLTDQRLGADTLSRELSDAAVNTKTAMGKISSYQAATGAT